MADTDSGQERTEEPSGRKLSDMREHGQVTRSQEIPMLACLVTGLTLLSIYGPEWGNLCAAALTGAFQFQAGHGTALAASWSRAYALPMFASLLRFMLITFAAVAIASLAQTGLVVAWKALAPKFESLNPLAGIKRIFSMQTTVQLVKNSLKVSVIGWIVYVAVRDDLSTVVGLSAMTLGQIMPWAVEIVMRIVVRVTIFLAILATADYGYQWFTHRKQAMMTKQEMKDEMKQQEVPPHVKSKVRQIAQERSRRIAQTEVPTADVIVTNPTHYAVAIRYRRGDEPAPRVVAKGQDRIAKLIRELATEHNVPLYEYPELARGLYRTVKEGAFVPVDMYEAVARVLAYIYRVRKQHSHGA